MIEFFCPGKRVSMTCALFCHRQLDFLPGSGKNVKLSLSKPVRDCQRTVFRYFTAQHWCYYDSNIL